MTLLNALKDRCVVQRYTEGTADVYGIPAKVWTYHLKNLPCRLVAGSGREIQIGARVVVAEYKLIMRGVDITEQDRVIIGGITYEVLLVADDQNGWELSDFNPMPLTAMEEEEYRESFDRAWVRLQEHLSQVWL